VETISDRIKEILTELDGPERGKQTRLAVIAGCTKALINQLLKNPSQQLGYEYAKKIEEELGWRVDWLLYGQMPKRYGAAHHVQHDDGRKLDGDEVIELVLLYKQCTKESRERVLRYARNADKAPGALKIVIPIDNS
jgi:hypothetical protein